jgi:hypothetical protein
MIAREQGVRDVRENTVNYLALSKSNTRSSPHKTAEATYLRFALPALRSPDTSMHRIRARWCGKY